MIEIVGVPLTQWDVNRKVEVTGEAKDVHFANPGDSKAVKRPLVNGQCEIPEHLLQTGKALNVYAVLDGVTLESRSFAVRKRERPEDYIYEKDQRDYIYTLIDEANEAIKNANDAAEEAREAAENCSGGAGGLPPMIVHAATIDADKANHTATEIYNHVQSGGNVFLEYLFINEQDTLFALLASSESLSIFSIDTGAEARYVTINENGDISLYTEKFLTEDDIAELKEDVGNISTALDHIIALQEELISL